MKIDTISMAKDMLQKNGINPEIYSIGPPISTECVVIENINGDLCTYYWKIGQKEPIKKHSNEAEAVAFFINKVVRVASLSDGKEIILS